MRDLCVKLVLTALLLQASGCGTLIYPERRGQTGGRVDPGIAILNAAGLLLFVIPGLIAFGVDFTTGAIYLPDSSASVPDDDGVRVVSVEPGELSLDGLDRLLADAIGGGAGLDDPRLEVYRVAGPEELRHHLRQQ